MEPTKQLNDEFPSLRFCRARDCRMCSLPQAHGYSPGMSFNSKSTGWTRTQSIGVAVVDNDQRVHRMFEQIFKKTNTFHCSGIFSTGGAALDSLTKVKVNLLLVEMGLSDICGIECAIRLLASHPEMRTIVSTSLRDPAFIHHAVTAGIDHCLIRPLRYDQCLASMRFVSCKACAAKNSRGPKFSPAGVAKKPNGLGRNASIDSREELVLKFLADGLLYKEIADRMGVSNAVLKKLQHRIFLKLNAQNRTQAVNHWCYFQNADV